MRHSRRRVGAGSAGMRVWIVFIGFLVAGCQSPQPEDGVAVSGPVEIPIESAANTRLAETQKAYAINRYVDPGDRRSMHERHVVYRVEEDAQWRLASNATQQILIGNTMGRGTMDYPPTTRVSSAESARRDAAIRAELETAISQMQVRSRNLANENLLLAEAVEALRSELGEVDALRTEVAAIAQAREKALQQFAEAAARAGGLTDGATAKAADPLVSEGLLTPEEQATLEGLDVPPARTVESQPDGTDRSGSNPAMIGEGF